MKFVLTAFALAFASMAHAQNLPEEYGKYVPRDGECSLEQHDNWTIMVAGKRISIWHPAVDAATGCRYGHDHGDYLGEYANHPDPVPEPEPGYAWTYDKWIPPAALVDPCTTDLHNTYSARGDDGLTYPTWHPATDPTGCHYGHSHGKDDPKLSPLYAEMGPPLFGYVAEQMSKQDVKMHRHESHEGYKVSWGHVTYSPPLLSFAPGLSCDVMSIIHMGTFNADAFTNNQHEQHFRDMCNDDKGQFVTRDHVRLMTIAGDPGGFHPTCGGTKPKDLLVIGKPVPADSPTTNPLADAGSLGIRRIPTSDCVIKPRPNGSTDMIEVWQTGSGVMSPDGTVVYRAHWYWFANLMSRYYDKRTGAMGKSLNTCYEKDLNGAYIVINNPCVNARRAMPDGPFTGVVCHPQNPYDGDDVRIRLTTLIKSNLTGPEVFYTDVHGQNPSTEYFPGSVLQEVSRGALPSRGARYTSTERLIGGKDTDAFLCDQN